MFSSVYSKHDYQHWPTISLPCTSSSSSLSSLHYFSPFKVCWCLQYLLSNLSLVSSRQHFQVLEECTGLQNLLVSLFIQFWSKEDVVLYGAILDPGLLWDVGYGALGGKDQTTWKAVPPEMQSWRSEWQKWGRTNGLRFEEMYVRLSEHLIFINVLVVIAPTREKDLIYYSPVKYPLFLALIL